MRLDYFRFLFKRVSGFNLTDEWVMFSKPIEIYNKRTDESIKFKKLEDALRFEIDGETIESRVMKKETLDIPPIEGGRGAGSDGNKHFKFQSADEGGGGPRNDKDLLPAYANTRIKSKTLEGAMDEFQKRFANADREFAYVVDSQGFVHRYVQGERHSVNVSANDRNAMILHNHPSGGAFSKADMHSIAMQNAKGIVASGRNYDYVLKKGGHFKANEFYKAINNATLTGKDYDDGVHNWLTKNQRKYGYTYYRKKNEV